MALCSLVQRASSFILLRKSVFGRPALAIKRSRLPVLVNASHSSLPGAIAIAEAAIESGAAGLLLMPPYFYAYSEDQIFEFYSQFVRSVGTGIRIYLYNLPMCTNSISPRLARRLLQTGSFAGIKDSSGAWICSKT